LRKLGAPSRILSARPLSTTTPSIAFEAVMEATRAFSEEKLLLPTSCVDACEHSTQFAGLAAKGPVEVDEALHRANAI
jgi:hypothetical protein